MIGIIIQARLGSTRLPKKVLLKLGEKTILDWVIDRARLVQGIDKIIVATSLKAQDDQILRFCKTKKIECFRGDELNVLKRYFLCAKKYSLKKIVRITSDCPFLDPKIIERLLELSKEKNADYCSLQTGEKILFPHGLDAEVIKFEALEKTYKNAKTKEDKEHVCTYMYKTAPQNFCLAKLSPDLKEMGKDIRITIDTSQDLKAARELIKLLPKEFDAKKIVQIYRKNPFLKKINRQDQN